MRSRTFLCNRADLRVDFTRFAPLWALYTVLLSAIMLLALPQCDCAYDRANAISSLAGVMVPIQFGYALLTAQCLFGYLFDSRQCCAIHAMPQARLCRYRSHLLSGLLFALVPDALAAGLCRILAPDTGSAAAWLLAAAGGQYLFFYGLAVLSALCAGNRVGGTLVYGIVNFLPVLALWLASSVFQPLLFGVPVPTEPFEVFFPLRQLTRENYFLISSRVETAFTYPILEAIAPNPEQMGILALWSALGLVFLLLGGPLYRRRHLECAGELLAVKALRPVFLLLFTLVSGAFFQLFAGILGNSLGYGYLLFGLLVGFYGGMMLLERQVNVFRLRTVPYALGICGVFFALLLLTGADAAGIIRSLPQESSVASVTVLPYTDGLGVTVSEPAEIQAVLTLHRGEVEHWKRWRQENRSLSGLLEETYLCDLEEDYDHAIPITLRYQLTNGRTVERTYEINTKSPGGQIAAEFLTRPENILGVRDKEALSRLAVKEAEVYGDWECGTYCTVDDVRGLLEAIYDDCRAGRVLPGTYLEDAEYIGSLSITTAGDGPAIWLTVYDTYTETVSFLADHVVPFPEYEEK